MRDEWLIRGKIPMTKSEVRAVSLSKLELEPGAVLYDIGAGTGSVSVEAARIRPDITVYAVEQKEEGVRLIRANAEKFHTDNVCVIPGKAPRVFDEPQLRDELKPPTHAFIGGTGGNLEAILDWLDSRNPQVRVVINVIALESLSQVTAYCRERDREAEVVCVQVARGERTGNYCMMKGQNPVYVISYGGKEFCL